MIRLLCSILVVMGFLFSVVGTTQAEILYQWRDASGQLRFTDNPAKVPAKHRSSAARDVNALEATSSGRPQDVRVAKIDGKALWSNRCTECHHVGFGRKGELRGLSGSIVDRVTHYPVAVDTLVSKLRSAADGDYDMPRQNLNDDELTAIARYLIQTQKN